MNEAVQAIAALGLGYLDKGYIRLVKIMVFFDGNVCAYVCE